jgi:hypothetical protein
MLAAFSGSKGVKPENKNRLLDENQLMSLRLAQTRFGRLLLHVACCLKRPDHLRWHWNGIVRELGAAPLQNKAI